MYRARVGQQQIQVILDAIEPLDHQTRGIGRPVNARDQKAARLAEIHPARSAPRGWNHSHMHVGVRGAGLWIPFRLGDGAQAGKR